MNKIYGTLSEMEEEFFTFIRQNDIDCEYMVFFDRAFSKHNLKPGKDLYPYIAVVQVFIAFYIFFFYDQLKSSDSPSFSEVIQFNSFSGEMVIALLCQILIILVERFIIQYQPESECSNETSMINYFTSGGRKLRKKQKVKTEMLLIIFIILFRAQKRKIK